MVSRVLKAYREEHKMSVAELARAMDIDNATCRNWLDGGTANVKKVDKALRGIGFRLAIVKDKK